MKTWADYLRAIKAGLKRRNKEIEKVIMAEISLPQGKFPKEWAFLKGNFPPSDLLLELSKARQELFFKIMMRER